MRSGYTRNTEYFRVLSGREMKVIKNIFAITFVFAIGLCQAQQYGSTDFEATGSPEAHKAFTLGLLEMHNFEYADALASFEKAQSIDPNFTMAYWGEAAMGIALSLGRGCDSDNA